MSPKLNTSPRLKACGSQYMFYNNAKIITVSKRQDILKVSFTMATFLCDLVHYKQLRIEKAGVLYSLFDYLPKQSVWSVSVIN